MPVRVVRDSLASLPSPCQPTAAEALLQSLTKRETEILQQFADGLTSKEIARLAGISPSTVDVHRNRILQKLGVHSTPLAVSMFMKRKD